MALTKDIRKNDDLLWGFRMRLAGLAGLLVGGAGLVFLLSIGVIWLGVVLLVLGGVGIAAGLAFEVRHLQGLVAARRGAAGSNVALQIALAAGLLIQINAFSFFHYQRGDWTSDREFTIAPELQRELSKLRGETFIIVHLTHNFGTLSGKRDEYDHAAERVVIDKVEDVAEELRALGPQLRVYVLDQKDKEYRSKLKEIATVTKTVIPRDDDETPGPEEKKGNDEKKKGEDGKKKAADEKKKSDDHGKQINLVKAIHDSTEDSIFLLAENKLQRLGFQELFQLDKKASRLADGKRGNLVLHYQGVGPLVRRILNMDERKPRIGVAVIHALLSTASNSSDLAMTGLAKTLKDNGFEVKDIILKDWETRELRPAAYTFDESRYDELQGYLARLEKRIQDDGKEVKIWQSVLERWKKAKPAVLAKEFADILEQFGEKIENDEDRERNIKTWVEPNLEERQKRVARSRNAQQEIRDEQGRLNLDDLMEQKRITDVKAKLERKLADVDLLILPRHTIIQLGGRSIPERLYRLDPAQEQAIQGFVKKGKPVLALLGPTTDASPVPMDMVHGQQDGIEMMFRRLGFMVDKQTILYDVETRFEQVGNLPFVRQVEDIPAARFEWLPRGRPKVAAMMGMSRPSSRPNPIAESMRLTVNDLDDAQRQKLEIKYPRQVSFLAFGAKKLPFDPTFLMTDIQAWPEPRPFPTETHSPQPNPNTKGQASIGVAVEATLPPDWNPEKPTARVALIGHGGVFIGDELKPLQQKLALDLCNWLLGRDDMLNHRQEEPWAYPRVQMSSSAFLLWQWGMRLGFPVLFAFMGVVVLMRRAMR
jgi:hypothetical protein